MCLIFWFPLWRSRMILVARTPATTRLSATVWRVTSTAAAQMTTRVKPVQSSRTTARPTSVEVAKHLKNPEIFKILFGSWWQIPQTLYPADCLSVFHFHNPKWLTVALLLLQPMTPSSQCGTSHPMCVDHTAAASACLLGTSAAPVIQDSQAPIAMRVSHY